MSRFHSKKKMMSHNKKSGAKSLGPNTLFDNQISNYKINDQEIPKKDIGDSIGKRVLKEPNSIVRGESEILDDLEHVFVTNEPKMIEEFNTFLKSLGMNKDYLIQIEHFREIERIFDFLCKQQNDLEDKEFYTEIFWDWWKNRDGQLERKDVEVAYLKSYMEKSGRFVEKDDYEGKKEALSLYFLVANELLMRIDQTFDLSYDISKHGNEMNSFSEISRYLEEKTSRIKRIHDEIQQNVVSDFIEEHSDQKMIDFMAEFQLKTNELSFQFDQKLENFFQDKLNKRKFRQQRSRVLKAIKFYSENRNHYLNPSDLLFCIGRKSTIEFLKTQKLYKVDEEIFRFIDTFIMKTMIMFCRSGSNYRLESASGVHKMLDRFLTGDNFSMEIAGFLELDPIYLRDAKVPLVENIFKMNYTVNPKFRYKKADVDSEGETFDFYLPYFYFFQEDRKDSEAGKLLRNSVRNNQVILRCLQYEKKSKVFLKYLENKNKPPLINKDLCMCFCRMMKYQPLKLL